MVNTMLLLQRRGLFWWLKGRVLRLCGLSPQFRLSLTGGFHRDFLTVVEPSPSGIMPGRGLAADWALPRQTHKPGTAAFRTMKNPSLLFHPTPSRPFFPGFPSVSICRFRLCFGGRALACSSNLKIIHSPPC